jgi:uncharacterized protein YjbI with pentapeptide repeats
VLCDANFEKVDLTFADFSSADLSNAILKNCNLEHAEFLNAKFTHCDLSGARLDNATGITESQLKDAPSHPCKMPQHFQSLASGAHCPKDPDQ